MFQWSCANLKSQPNTINLMQWLVISSYYLIYHFLSEMSKTYTAKDIAVQKLQTIQSTISYDKKKLRGCNQKIFGTVLQFLLKKKTTETLIFEIGK